VKYPKSISSQLDEVQRIISSWPRKISLDDVMNWVLQFDSDDYDLAIRVIRNLNVIGHDDLSSALLVAYSKLMRKAIEKDARITNKNTLFAGIGDAGKSGSMMSYHFRIINEGISEENFLDDETIEYLEQGLVENIVLVDDVISTGYQASKEIEKLTAKVTPLGVKNIFVLAACGMKEGIQKVEEETKAYTFSAFEYDSSDTISSLDSSFYEGIPFEGRESLRKRLGTYGGICYRKNPLGFGGVGGLLVFYYNTPNTTLPVIWSDVNGWIPLFKRVRRINGIASYYSQFEKVLEEKTSTPPQPEPVPEHNRELSLFVEGKTDEIFFDLLVKEFNLAQELGFQKVDIVSLGGTPHSEKLLLTLSKLKSPALFVFEDDDMTGYSRRILEPLKSKIHYVLVGTSIFEFIDTEELSKNEEIVATSPLFLELLESSKESPFSAHSERFFRRMPPIKRDKFLKAVVPRFLNQDKFQDFIQRARGELARPLEVQEIQEIQEVQL
jgi:hypothetical protein